MRGIILINVHKNRKKCIDCRHAKFELKIEEYFIKIYIKKIFNHNINKYFCIFRLLPLFA